MKVDDLEKASHEIRRLKKENLKLQEDNTFLKVNAEKYQKRAIYVRKKFGELTSKTQSDDFKQMTQTQVDSKYRLQCSQLQKKLKDQ